MLIRSQKEKNYKFKQRQKGNKKSKENCVPSKKLFETSHVGILKIIFEEEYAFDEHCLLLTYVTTLRQRWRRRVAIEELFETNSRRDIENRRCHQEKLWRCWKMQRQKVHRTIIRMR